MKGVKKVSLFTRLMRAAYFVLILVLTYLFFSNLAGLIVKPSSSGFVFASSSALSLSFPASAILYLKLVEKGKKGIVERLGLDPGGITLRNVLLGVYVFFLIVLLEVTTGLIENVTHTQIQTNVQSLFSGAPMWFYAFAALLAPLDEELLFRGLMVTRVGIVLSALLFALPHWSYNSTFSIEVIAAFIFGLLAGYVYKKTGSLYPSLIAHVLVNLLTIYSTFSMFI